MSTSDTPRTDAAENAGCWANDTDYYVEADFARQLERELSAAQARIAEQAALLAVLERDKARLDWLSTQCYLPGDHPDDGLLVVVSEKFAPLGSFNLSPNNDAVALRAAIDAAMTTKATP